MEADGKALPVAGESFSWLGAWIAEHGVSALLTAAALSFALFVLIRLARRWGGIEDSIFSNWRLGLLGATGIVLSLASGWTTWDGMRNFTKEPLLSGMITFGIQGVMLIVAWLIGESFATGMSQRARAERRGMGKAVQAVAGSVIGLMAFAAMLAVGLHFAGLIDVRTAGFTSFDWSRFGDTYLILGAALLVFVLVMVSGGDLGKPYVQGTRVIVRNAVLWVMFLACMATSVFFSFDSLFSAIFPKDERARAAELRAQNQVAGITADIGQTISDRRIHEAEALFKAEGWRAYEKQLAGIAEAARQSEGAIEHYFNDQLESKNRAIKEQQERIVTAETGQAGLAGKKASLADELARLKGGRPALAAEFAEKKGDVDARAKEIDAKRVEALAEDKGVEGTGKEGKGPVWRQRQEELGKLQAAAAIAGERFKDAKKRLDAVDARIANVERELSAVDGELAKLKGEAETAGQRIKLTEAAVSVDADQQIDPARMVPVFEKARAEFRREPAAERLATVRQICGQIYNAMASTEPTKAKIKGFDCDPKQASEAAAVMFALNAGSKSFDANCAGGDKLAHHNGTDALFGFARGCLADSGLPSKETDQLRTKINVHELNRDDKAHRFVVTWNAFEDGNRLAYLALAIAIAIDGLIFMSGLFGANAVRSPLSDVPKARARSAQQLEATINAALGVRQYETASRVLSVLRPISNVDGFSALATLDGLDRGTADRVRQVLTAGADIGAVEPAGTAPESYRVRSELREYLSTVCDKHLKSDPSHERRDRLQGILRAALKPHTKEHADIVAHAMSPIQTTRGFTSTVLLTDIKDAYESRIVRRVMNAGATLEVVSPDETEADRYYIRPELYETLLEISAHDPPSAAYEQDRYGPRPQLGPRGDIAGGNITPKPEALPDRTKGTLQITRVMKPNGQDGEKPRNILNWFWGTKGAAHAGTADAGGGEDIDQSVSDNDPPPKVKRAFVEKLGLIDRQLDELLDLQHINAVQHTETQLGTIADNDPLFKRRISGLRERMRHAIDHAVAELGAEGHQTPLVSYLAEYLRKIWPLILLVHQGGYPRMLEDLLVEAEGLSGQAFPGGLKRDWLRIVRDHADDLAPLPRAEPEDWPRVQECLLRLSKRLAELNKAGRAHRHGQQYIQ